MGCAMVREAAFGVGLEGRRAVVCRLYLYSENGERLGRKGGVSYRLAHKMSLAYPRPLCMWKDD